MPVYEFACKKCDKKFELLILGSAKAACPSCSTEDVERLLSLPAVKSDTTRGLAMRAARKRDQKLGHERVQEQIRYEQSHDD